MKRLTLTLIFVMAFFGSAMAHNGAISLYTDETITKCDGIVQLFETFNVNIYYVRDQGQDIGRGAEFRLMKSNPSSVLIQDPTWSTKVAVTLGSLETGISLVSAECMGPGEAVTYIGTVPIMNLGDPDTFTVRVVKHPETIPNPEIRITVCDPANPIAVVLGGTFVFSGDPMNPGSCNPAVRSRTWGSIKALYQ